jgi:lipoyl-dependent peroxiredoxin
LAIVDSPASLLRGTTIAHNQIVYNLFEQTFFPCVAVYPGKTEANSIVRRSNKPNHTFDAILNEPACLLKRCSIKPTPKVIGGADNVGTNPEQLFAAGYAACFIGALKFVAGQKKVKLPDDLSINSTVGIGQIPGGFGIETDLQINSAALDKAVVRSIVDAAHHVCPYSNAARNNTDVRSSVV